MARECVRLGILEYFKRLMSPITKFNTFFIVFIYQFVLRSSRQQSKKHGLAHMRLS